MKIKVRLIQIPIWIIVLTAIPMLGQAQGFSGPSRVSGNLQVDAQYYRPDSLIGAPEVDEQMLMNAFANVLYTKGNFTAGIRFEYYLNPIIGYDQRYEGYGIPYRFINYKAGDFDFTVGNFYEQFGNGMILRSYEDWSLGVDNSIDGIRVKYNPQKAIAITGIYGKQRYFWDRSQGIVRGIDADLTVNDLFKSLQDKVTLITLGGGMVSKYQESELILVGTDQLILPENVAAYSGRLNLNHSSFNFISEYAYKINDPSEINNYIYKPGQSLLLTGTYFRRGFSFLLSAKHTDNMSYKSQRTETENVLDINYLPPLTTQNTKALPSMYPYATQPNGEVAYQAQMVYTIKRNTKIGGPQGTFITVNYSLVNSLNMTAINDTTAIGEKGTLGYNARLFDSGDEKYYNDFLINISRRMNRKLKLAVEYTNLNYNIAVIEGKIGQPNVKANIGLVDVEYKFTPIKTGRLELQHLWTEQDKGNWAAAMIEYTIAPKWFFNVSDQFNYGNPDDDKQLHYYNFAMGYTHHSSRISLGWGRQREGIVCVGGVCRRVPASSGLTLSIVSSF